MSDDQRILSREERMAHMQLITELGRPPLIHEVEKYAQDNAESLKLTNHGQGNTPA